MADVRESLARLGVRIDTDFIATITSRLGLPAVPDQETLYAHFLESDMNLCGSGCLPLDLESRHNTVLQGCYVLQIDEAADMAACAKQRQVNITVCCCVT
jgi:hypothetical protein